MINETNHGQAVSQHSMLHSLVTNKKKLVNLIHIYYSSIKSFPTDINIAELENRMDNLHLLQIMSQIAN